MTPACDFSCVRVTSHPNAQAAGSAFFHAVYCRLAQLDVEELELDGERRLGVRYTPVLVDGL